MSINWNDELKKVEEGTRPISEGVHTFRITEAKVTTASTGNKMVKVTARVEGGPDDGKYAYVNFVFAFDNPRAMKMTLRRLSGFGITGEFLAAQNPSLEQIAASMLGRSAVGTVSHREWNKEIQADVDFGGGDGTPGVVAPPSIATPGIGVPNVGPAAAPPAPSIPTPQVPTPDVPAARPGMDEQPF